MIREREEKNKFDQKCSKLFDDLMRKCNSSFLIKNNNNNTLRLNDSCALELRKIVYIVKSEFRGKYDFKTNIIQKRNFLSYDLNKILKYIASKILVKENLTNTFKLNLNMTSLKNEFIYLEIIGEVVLDPGAVTQGVYFIYFVYFFISFLFYFYFISQMN